MGQLAVKEVTAKRRWSLALVRTYLHEIVCEIASSQVQTEDGVGQSVPLVDGHGVGDAIAGVEHDTGCAPGGVQGQHGLDRHVHGRCVKCLEHDL